MVANNRKTRKKKASLRQSYLYQVNEVAQGRQGGYLPRKKALSHTQFT